MAYVFNRGTREAPAWYGRYRDTSGKWRMIATGQAKKKDAQKWIDALQGDVDAGKPDPRALPTVGTLIDRWLESLDNRNAYDDRCRARKHVRPYFADLKLPELTRKRVVEWLEALKALSGDERLSSASQRQCFNLLSRFFSWCIDHDYTEVNVCRMIPIKSKARPSGKPETTRVHLDDEDLARTIFHRLANPFHLIHLTTYESGARPGEACGLRLSDTAWLEEENPDDRLLRVRFSRLGPLKESDGSPSAKWLPTSDDLCYFLVQQRKRRELEGAAHEDLLIPHVEIDANGRRQESPISKMQLSREWARLKAPKEDGGEGLELPAGLTWYGVGRHAAITRWIENGASMADASRGAHHSDVRVTRKHYVHVERTPFPSVMRRGLGVLPDLAKRTA